MPPGVARDALIDQAGAARRNLHNLGERRIELASFGPLDRLKARLGFGTLSVRLEQPPRLFSKMPTRRLGAKSGPAAPVHVDEARRVVGELRAQIEGLERRAARRGGLSASETAHLEMLRGQLREHYAVLPPDLHRAQEASLFDPKPKETLPEYHERLERLRNEVEENAIAQDNGQLLDRYESQVRRTRADLDETASLRSQLDEIGERQRKNSLEWNENVRERNRASPEQLTDLNLERAAIERDHMALRAEQARITGRIDALERRGSLFFGDQPWTSIALVDPLDPHIKSKVGLVGELDTAATLMDAGFEPLGRTVDPRHVKTMEGFDTALQARRGQQDIDGIFKRSGPDATEYVVGDSKATGEVNPREPQGRGRLKTMASDEDVHQLGHDWLSGHLPDAQLSARDLRNLQEALKYPGQKVTVKHPDGTVDVVIVNRVYAHTFRDSAGVTRTRLYHVVGEPVSIGGRYDP